MSSQGADSMPGGRNALMVQRGACAHAAREPNLQDSFCTSLFARARRGTKPNVRDLVTSGEVLPYLLGGAYAVASGKQGAAAVEPLEASADPLVRGFVIFQNRTCAATHRSLHP